MKDKVLGEKGKKKAYTKQNEKKKIEYMIRSAYPELLSKIDKKTLISIEDKLLSV